MTTAVLSCRTCGVELQRKSSRGRAPMYCSLRCKRGRPPLTETTPVTPARRTSDSPTENCTIPECARPLRARGLCAMHWRQRYGKRPTALEPCTVCGTEVTKRTDRNRRVVCSDVCRAYLQHGIWPRCDIPKRHGARGYVPPEKRPRFVPTQRPCLWCGTEFTARRADALYCTEPCSTKAKRVRRRGREHNAGGTYTWTEVIALFLAFDRCCAYCRQEIEGQPDPDHVVPLSRGGSNSITNILPSCKLCNSDKRDLLLHEWAADRDRRHLPPRITEWRRGDPLYVHLSIIQAHEHAA